MHEYSYRFAITSTSASSSAVGFLPSLGAMRFPWLPGPRLVPEQVRQFPVAKTAAFREALRALAGAITSSVCGIGFQMFTPLDTAGPFERQVSAFNVASSAWIALLLNWRALPADAGRTMFAFRCHNRLS